MEVGAAGQHGHTAPQKGLIVDLDADGETGSVTPLHQATAENHVKDGEKDAEREFVLKINLQVHMQ